MPVLSSTMLDESEFFDGIGLSGVFSCFRVSKLDVFGNLFSLTKSNMSQSIQFTDVGSRFAVSADRARRYALQRTNEALKVAGCVWRALYHFLDTTGCSAIIISADAVIKSVDDVRSFLGRCHRDEFEVQYLHDQGVWLIRVAFYFHEDRCLIVPIVWNDVAPEGPYLECAIEHQVPVKSERIELNNKFSDTFSDFFKKLTDVVELELQQFNPWLPLDRSFKTVDLGKRPRVSCCCCAEASAPPP